MKYISSFKIFEYHDKDNLIPIATNESNWSWEYDSVNIEAIIYFDRNTEKLYLHIRKTHTKSGIGAGQVSVDLVDYEPIGTITKPQLKKVQTLLSKYKYTDRPFKRQWTDMKGENLSLGKIISKSRFLKLSKIKNKLKSRIKSQKSEEPRISNIDDIKIMKYGRGYVIYGEGTRKIKDDIKSLGARFNFRLTDPRTGEKFSGWVISPRKLEQAKELTGAEVEEFLKESYSIRYILQLKQDILNIFDDRDIINFFPKMYEGFFDIITDYSKLDYNENLEFDFAEATQIYIQDNYNDSLEIKFLESYLKDKEYSSGKNRDIYDDLSENAKIIYNNLEQRMDIVFWTMLENGLL